MSDFDRLIARLAAATGGQVFGVLAWIDPLGRWWLAPLGTPAPDPDRALPAPWVPIVRLDRRDLHNGGR
jgi:hypothetical protein